MALTVRSFAFSCILPGGMVPPLSHDIQTVHQLQYLMHKDDGMGPLPLYLAAPVSLAYTVSLLHHPS